MNKGRLEKLEKKVKATGAGFSLVWDMVWNGEHWQPKEPQKKHTGRWPWPWPNPDEETDEHE